MEPILAVLSPKFDHLTATWAQGGAIMELLGPDWVGLDPLGSGLDPLGSDLDRLGSDLDRILARTWAILDAN